MTARIVDGRELSATVRATLIERVRAAGRPARLDAVLVGSDRAAGIYAENQAKTCAAVGIEYRQKPDALGFVCEVVQLMLSRSRRGFLHVAPVAALPQPMQFEAAVSAAQRVIEPEDLQFA